MPAIDGGIELHAGVAALPRGFGDVAHEFAGHQAIFLFTAADGLGPPFFVLDDGLHEFVGGADGVVGVLEEDGAVGFAIERSVVAGFDEGVRLLLFFGFAPDEVFDIGVLGVEDDHFRRAAGFAAGFDDAGEGVEAFMKESGPLARPPLERSPFSSRSAERLVPVPEPHLKSMPSVLARSRMASRESFTETMKQASTAAWPDW